MTSKYISFFVVVLITVATTSQAAISDRSTSLLDESTDKSAEDQIYVNESVPIGGTESELCTKCSSQSDCASTSCMKGFCVENLRQVFRCRRKAAKKERREKKKEKKRSRKHRKQQKRQRRRERRQNRRHNDGGKEPNTETTLSSCERCQTISDCKISTERCLHGRCASNLAARMECPITISLETGEGNVRRYLRPECAECKLGSECVGGRCVEGYCMVGSGSHEKCVMATGNVPLRSVTTSSKYDDDNSDVVDFDPVIIEENEVEDVSDMSVNDEYDDEEGARMEDSTNEFDEGKELEEEFEIEDVAEIMEAEVENSDRRGSGAESLVQDETGNSHN